jgi:hypothetical protein
VLRELQMVPTPPTRSSATAAAALDILQRIQKLPNVDVQIVDQDFPRSARST